MIEGVVGMDLKFLDQTAQCLFNSMLTSDSALSDAKTKAMAEAAYHRALILCDVRKAFLDEHSLCKCACVQGEQKEDLPEEEEIEAGLAKCNALNQRWADIETRYQDLPKPILKPKKEVKEEKKEKKEKKEKEDFTCQSVAVAAKRGRGRPRKVS